MFCRNCGKMIQDGNKFCTGCGMKVEPITLKKNVESVNNVSNVQANPVNNTKKTNVVINKDKASIGFNILAFFLPIVGLILFLVMKDNTPKKAKGIGISALVGYIISMVLSFISIMFVVIIAIMSSQEAFDDINTNEGYCEYHDSYDCYEDYDYPFDCNYDYDYEFNGNYNI